MNKLIFAGAAALALAIPAGAQELAVAADGDVYVLTPTQKPVYDAWPLERRSGYDAWSNDFKVYYWTLTPTQQEGWWMLNDEQRTRLYAMAPEARVAAWESIAKQMASLPSANASATAQVATTAAAANAVAGRDPQMVSNAVTQTTPAATAGEYPLCSATVTDSCINPREAGKNYGNRPLNYWPGRPASEIPGKKPQK
ncbi:hypothetical protein ACWPM1_04460 [Tsuneonella sp. HG249]